MITENELQLSNMSYVNKDFQTIYPELLDLVKKLTNRWDPSSSNESDPGNVLLKLLAAVGDKVNYNVDKNVLECFMPSATQESSMRSLTEAVGYNMKYYNSATTEITFKYDDDISNTSPIRFNMFDTVISNQDNTVSYTLLEDVTLSYRGIAQSGLAIEGTLESLLVNDNEVIKLDNIDDNNRLYFPTTYVAENGVFITNNGYANFSEWKKVDNLNTQIPLTRCYKFSFDSGKGLPYIEFPSDIAQLIGSGILVSYIVTSGDAGNVSAYVLNTLKSTSLEGLDTTKLTISNNKSATNGREKETINEAYNNFKKIIGTFDTLITTRDYGNAIYNMMDEYNTPIVSNAKATDRTDDFNYSTQVVSYDNYGQYMKLSNSSSMNFSDVALYPLKPYVESNYNVYSPSSAYDESYLPLKEESTTHKFVDTDIIKSNLSTLKCISHTYKELRPEDVFLFKNVAALDAQIFTYSKVNAIEQVEIKRNILKALSDNFNARKVDYGYEIPYDTLLETIYNADSRIKLVNLTDPDYNTYVVFANGTIEPLESASTKDEDNVTQSINTLLAAKNVLAGRISLFEYDGKFDWEFGQVNNSIYDNAQTLATELEIPLSDNINNDDFNYDIGKNEIIQLVSPNLQTTTIYPANVYYRFTNDSSSDTGIIVAADSNYTLQPGETFRIYYIDSDNNTVFQTLPDYTIIRPTFDLYYTNLLDTNINNFSYIQINDGGTSVNYIKIETNNKLEIRDYVKTKLDQIATPIYWVRNNEGNTLFPANETDIILDSGEYFIYSNSAYNELTVLGAGTRITRVGSTDEWSIPNAISLESINNNGLDAFTSSDWQVKAFTSSNYIELQEMNVVNLGANVQLKISFYVDQTEIGYNNGEIDTSVDYEGEQSLEGINLSGDFIIIKNAVISYYYNGNTSTLSSGGDTWYIRTRLDLEMGPDTPQQIVSTDDQESGTKSQTIKIWLIGNSDPDNPDVIVEGTDGTEGNEIYIESNYDLSLSGGDNIDLSVTNILTGVTSYSLSFNVFNKRAATVTTGAGTASEETKEISTAGIINVPIDEDMIVKLPMNVERFNDVQPTQEEIELGIDTNYQPFATYMVPILLSKGDNSTTTVTLSSDLLKFYDYNTGEPIQYDSGGVIVYNTIKDAGLYNVEVKAAWLAEYDTYSDLTDARPLYAPVTLETSPLNWPTGYYTRSGSGTAGDPYVYTPVAAGTTFSEGTYYVKPNQSGDICKVLTDESSFDAGWYEWYNDEWSFMQDMDSDYPEIVLNCTIGEGSETDAVLTVGGINKIKGINPAILTVTTGDNLVSMIRNLTEDSGVTFYYNYIPYNSDLIESTDLSNADALWDVNNIANQLTLPAIDLEGSNIYIARSSTL